jgi:hypothetical protein
MDVPTRQSYTMAIVDPDERTATAGLTSVVRSTAQAAGPLLAASLITLPLGGLSAPLIACAGLKITYDIALYVLFRRRPAPDEVPSTR